MPRISGFLERKYFLRLNSYGSEISQVMKILFRDEIYFLFALVMHVIILQAVLVGFLSFAEAINLTNHSRQ